MTKPLDGPRRTDRDPVPATSLSPLLTGIPLRPAKTPLKLPRLTLRLTLLAVLLIGCGEATPPRSLHELTIQDSTYLDPETLLPYTGRVFRMFETDPEMRQLRGELVDGAWEGELVVYHDNGRIRYLGSFANGERCGPWLENRDAEPPEDIYEGLKQEVESMGLYPKCPA